MGITSLIGQVAAEVLIDGHALPEQMTSAIRSIKIVENSKYLFPMVEIEIADIYNILKDELALTEENKISITLANTQGDDKETSHFRAGKIKSSPADTGFIYRIPGILDAPQYTKGIKMKSYKGSSSTVLKKVLREAGLKISKKFKDTSDDQVWINPGLTVSTFVQQTVNHAFLSQTALLRFGVTSRGYARFVDMFELLNQKAEHILVYGDKIKHKGDYMIKDLQQQSVGGFFGGWVGYGYNVFEPRLDGKVMKSDGVALDLKGNYTPLNRDSYDKIDAVRQDYVPAQSGNTHDNYWAAYHGNLRKAAMFTQGAKILIEEFTDIELFDVVDIKMPPMQFRGMKDRQDNAEVASGGTYVVVAKQRVIKGTKYAEFFSLLRLAINVSGKSKLLSDAGRGSPTPTPIKQEDDGKPTWTYETEARYADPKDGCFDIVDEECMPTGTDSTDWDTPQHWTDGFAEKNGPYEVALTEKVGEVKKREKDTDPPSK